MPIEKPKIISQKDRKTQKSRKLRTVIESASCLAPSEVSLQQQEAIIETLTTLLKSQPRNILLKTDSIFIGLNSCSAAISSKSLTSPVLILCHVHHKVIENHINILCQKRCIPVLYLHARFQVLLAKVLNIARASCILLTEPLSEELLALIKTDELLHKKRPSS